MADASDVGRRLGRTERDSQFVRSTLIWLPSEGTPRNDGFYSTPATTFSVPPDVVGLGGAFRSHGRQTARYLRYFIQVSGTWGSGVELEWQIRLDCIATNDFNTVIATGTWGPLSPLDIFTDTLDIHVIAGTRIHTEPVVYSLYVRRTAGTGDAAIRLVTPLELVTAD